MYDLDKIESLLYRDSKTIKLRHMRAYSSEELDVANTTRPNLSVKTLSALNGHWLQSPKTPLSGVPVELELA